MEAVQAVKESMAGGPGVERIDVILMDSVMTGLEATKAIRGLKYDGVIIGVTGNVSTEDVSSFLNHGADAVLPKPLYINAFGAAVLQLLSSRIPMHDTHSMQRRS